MTDSEDLELVQDTKERRWLPIVLGIGLLVLLFGVILPSLIDFAVVFEAIRRVSAAQWALLVVIAAVRFIPDAWVLQTSLAGLNHRQGLQIANVSGALANVPPGGLDLVARYQMCRGWGFTGDASSASVIISYMFTTAAKLVLPLLALLVLDLNRIRADGLDFIALIGLVVVVVGFVLLAMGLRSARFLAWMGRVSGRALYRLARLVRREVSADLESGFLEFRETAAHVLRGRWHVGILSGILVQGMLFLALLVSVRSIGVDSDVVSAAQVFAAFAAVAAVTSIPLMTSAGIYEATLIAALVVVMGPGSTDLASAAVILYSLVTWLLPIPFGAFAYSRWRKSKEPQSASDQR